MRGILVDWLVEVAAEFRLVSDTLFSAVGFVDRVLSARAVPRARLQLVGVACMLLASKYEEIYAPQVDEFVFITDNTYSRDELLAAEKEALGDLRFSLSAPTSKTFLRRFVKAALADGCGSADADAKLPPLAAYVCELALLEYDAVAFLPSQVRVVVVVFFLLFSFLCPFFERKRCSRKRQNKTKNFSLFSSSRSPPRASSSRGTP